MLKNKAIFFCLILICQSGFSYAADKLRVIDSDTGKGLRSVIEKVDASYKITKVSTTNENGYAQNNFECEELEQLIVKPFYHQLYYKDEFDCPLLEKTLTLKSNKRQHNLIRNAEESVDAGDFGTAALAYTEAAFRLSSLKQHKKEYINLEYKAYKAAGNYLSVEDSTVFDQRQNKDVMSQELKEAVIQLQVEKGIKATGVLDFKTLSAISNKTVSEIIFSSPDK